jgi:hypothetical protein
MCTTQLYHALRHEQLLDQEWKDLQTLWDMQGNAAYFVGEPSTNFEGYFRNYCMSLGTSTTNWASNKRKKTVKTTQATVRDMMLKGATSRRLASRIQTNGDERPVIGEDIHGFITEGEAHRSHHTRTNGASHLRLPLIHKLAATIEAEIPDITFDYFAMHDKCWELMLRLKDAFDNVIGADLTRQWSAQQSNLPFVVGFVFSTAAGRKDIDTKGVPSEQLLVLAAGTVGRFLEEGNGKVIVDKERRF